MPLHGYTTDRRPPSNVDHLYAHPYAIVLALWQIVGGLLTMLTTLTHLTVSQSVERMAQPLIAALAVLLVAGGAQTIRGLLNDDDDLMQGWKIERTGLILSAAAWGAYAVTILFAFPSSILTWSFALGIAVANAIRCRATVVEERRTRDRIKRQGA